MSRSHCVGEPRTGSLKQGPADYLNGMSFKLHREITCSTLKKSSIFSVTAITLLALVNAKGSLSLYIMAPIHFRSRSPQPLRRRLKNQLGIVAPTSHLKTIASLSHIDVIGVTWVHGESVVSRFAFFSVQTALAAKEEKLHSLWNPTSARRGQRPTAVDYVLLRFHYARKAL